MMALQLAFIAEEGIEIVDIWYIGYSSALVFGLLISPGWTDTVACGSIHREPRSGAFVVRARCLGGANDDAW